MTRGKAGGLPFDYCCDLRAEVTSSWVRWDKLLIERARRGNFPGDWFQRDQFQAACRKDSQGVQGSRRP